MDRLRIPMTSNFFRTAREKAKLTQFQAAVAIGVTTSAISGWERGQTPNLKLAEKISEIYGVPVPRLLQVMKEFAEAMAEK